MAQLAHDCLVRHSRGSTRQRPRRAGQPTFEPVIRLLGTGWPFFIALNIRCAWAWFQTSTSPTASVSEAPIGTVVVSGWRSANATWMSWYSWVPLSTVSELAAPLAAENALNGLASVPTLVILVSSALMNTR